MVVTESGTPMNYYGHDYSEISRTAKLFTIESHYKVNDLNLVAKIVHDQLNVPEIKNKFVDRNVSYDLRLIRPLQEQI